MMKGEFRGIFYPSKRYFPSVISPGYAFFLNTLKNPSGRKKIEKARKSET
jgi:hypothetical protein